MKYELIKETNKNYTPLEQILTNRGIPIEEVERYANLTDEVISPPEIFGEELMHGALETFLSAIRDKKKMCVIVD